LLLGILFIGRAVILAVVAVLDAAQALRPLARTGSAADCLREVVLDYEALGQFDLLVDEATEDDHTDVDDVEEEKAEGFPEGYFAVPNNHERPKGRDHKDFECKQNVKNDVI